MKKLTMLALAAVGLALSVTACGEETVPDVVGMNPQEAIDALHDADLNTNSHGGLGRQEDTGFVVCETKPAAGESTGGEVEIYSRQDCKPRSARAKRDAAEAAAKKASARRARRAEARRQQRLAAQRRARRARARRARATRERLEAAAPALATTEREEAVAPPAEPASECDSNYAEACLDPNSSDYDCEGGSGDGPDYTGIVEVVGGDPYDLDRDGDGIACDV